MQKLLSITNLKKYFPMPKASVFSKQVYNRANEDITLNIYKGETFGLVGDRPQAALCITAERLTQLPPNML